VAEQLAKVGDVIQPGESIPEGVSEVLDKGSDRWAWRESRGWYCLKYWEKPPPSASSGYLHDRNRLADNWGPLTVTAVREPEPNACHKCGRTTGKLVEVNDRGKSMHAYGSCDSDGEITQSVARSFGLEWPRPGQADDVPTFHVDEIFPAEKPQQADASVLLDLVRQYGDERNAEGRTLSNPADGMDVVRAHSAKAADLFDRIAALVPQHPVQARDQGGLSLWLHPCGAVMPFRVPPNGEAHHCFPVCKTPGPWRPLLVGGDCAPQRDPGAPLRCSRCGAVDWLITGQVWECKSCQLTMTPRADDVLAQAIAERDDARANLTRALQARGEFLDETIRLRGEVERLKADVTREIEQADAHAKWADRLAHAVIARYGIELDEHAGDQVWHVAHDVLWSDAVPVHAAPQQDGPRTLTLPEVPEGAIALIDRHERRWTLSGMTDLATDGGGWVQLWESGSGALRAYPALLTGSGPLTVEVAPPREPRTWPAVTGAENGLKVRGSSGNVYHFREEFDGGTSMAYVDRIGETFFGCWMNLGALSEVDGPLTEVLDEPGGQQ
jgi:hypothetical protein